MIYLQTTHVAAQYGQTAFLYHIVMKRNADPDVPDNDGRSPLHWYDNYRIVLELESFVNPRLGHIACFVVIANDVYT